MRLASLVFAIAVLGIASGAPAQQAQLEVASGPYYVGVPVQILVSAAGFDLEPEPEVQVQRPSTGELRYEGVLPQRSSSVFIVNGQVKREDRVSFTYRYNYVAAEPGTLEIGPFRVVQGGKEVSTQSYRLRFADTPRSPQLEVRLETEVETAYIGSPIRAKLVYRIDAQLDSRIVDLDLSVPAFSLTDAFRFEADPDAPAQRQVDLRTGDGGVVRTRAQSREERSGGRRVKVTELAFVMVPLQAGQFALAPTKLLAEEGTGFRRGFLGRREATGVRPLSAVDQPRRLVVKETPSQGRPPSFGGAVGRGFSIEVEAERTVVRAGDPVPLTITLRGDGPLEIAGLPDLTAPGMLPSKDFAVAAGSTAGIIEGDVKRFSVSVRPKSARVREIPALSYAYFDPRKERFEVVKSNPIALSVGEAQVVGADQVIRETDPADEAEDARGADGADASRTSRTSREPSPMDLTGADLSIDRDLARLRRSVGGAFGWAATGGLYLAGLAALGFALFDARRRAGDPRALAARKEMRGELAAMEAALASAGPDTTRSLANALRAMRAKVAQNLSAESGREIDALLARCDDVVFAPSGAPERADRGELHRQLVDRARRLVDEL